MTAKWEFIAEAKVTTWGMGVSYNFEYSSTNRPFSRNLVWAREFVWDDCPLEAAEKIAMIRLHKIGYQPLGWWVFDTTKEGDGAGAGVPYLYTVLERIPGSTASWKD